MGLQYRVMLIASQSIGLITDNLLTTSSAFSILVLSFDCLSRRRSRPVAHTRPTLQSTGC